MGARTEFSNKTKREAFARCKGCCERCGAAMKPGEPEYHHRTPCIFDGDNSLENCEVLCRICHRGQTDIDVADRARQRKNQDRNAGIKRAKSGRGFRGWRNFKGEVVWRR